MKILLLQSPTGRPEPPLFPLGLAYLAGQLEEHEIHALDLALEPRFVDSIEAELRRFEPDSIALSLRNIDDSSYPITHSYVEPFAALIEALESWSGLLCVGGTGFTLYPERLLELFPRIDAGIAGEGEIVLPRILTGGSDPRSRLIRSEPVSLEAIRPPRYDILEPAPYREGFSVGVQTRRGCPFDCSYCTYGFLGGRRFRGRPVERVLADLEQLRGLGVRSFAFVDSVFNAPAAYFEELLDALRSHPPGMSWSSWIDESITETQLEKMAESGAAKVDFSPDAITDRGLELLGKKARASELLPAIGKARSKGMFVGVNFFNNNPGEGLGAFLRKIVFTLWVRLRMGWGMTAVNIGTIRAYAHSEIAERMLAEGKVERTCDFFAPLFYRESLLADLAYRGFALLRRIRHGNLRRP